MYFSLMKKVLVVSILAIGIIGSSVANAAVYLEDDFSYTGPLDSSKWAGPWGDAPSVNGSYCEFTTTGASITSSHGFTVPADSVTTFDFQRPTGTVGNTMFHLYDVWMWHGVFNFEATPGPNPMIYVYAHQNGVDNIVKSFPYNLDTWYSVVATSHADAITTDLEFYDGVTLVDQVTYVHDAVGMSQFRVAACGNTYLDNVLIVPEPISLLLLSMGAVTLYRRKRQR